MANPKKLDLMVGPFAEVQERLEDFTSKLYLQKLYNETIGELIETQRAYEIALGDSDGTRAKALSDQIKFLENVVALANNNMTSYLADEIYYD